MRADHPEYEKHLAHREQAERYREAVAKFHDQSASDTASGTLQWTPAEARALLAELQALFKAYNQTLWQAFPYCSRCLGGCCVVDATDLKPLDYIALSLLDEPLPERPQKPAVNERACIYLTPAGCSWPKQWRPLKCAAFYCLGSAAIELEASDERYLELTAALQKVVAAHLPETVSNDEREILLDALPDPVSFAALLDDIVAGPLVSAIEAPLAAPSHEPPAPSVSDPLPATLDFIVAASDTFLALEIECDSRFLEDLEMLEWLLLAHPAQQQKLVAEMAVRYQQPAPLPELEELWTGMRHQLQQISQ